MVPLWLGMVDVEEFQEETAPQRGTNGAIAFSERRTSTRRDVEG